MFPTLRHRVLIVIAAVLGAVIWLTARPMLAAVDGGSGFSLMFASAGWAKTTIVLAILGVPVLLLGLFISSSGHPLSGVFAVAAALCVLAGSGGSIDGWLWRQADADALPQAYGLLMAEMFIWSCGIAFMLAAIGYLRSPMRARFPALAYEDHLGVDLVIRFPQLQAIVSGIAAAVFAGIAGWVLIRSSDVGQVMWGLVVAFTIGAAAGHAMFPQSNPVGILLSPALVAMAAYGWLMVSGNFSTTEQVLDLVFGIQFQSPLPAGLALALPIHYASAGVVGCTLGIGLTHAFETARPAEQSPEAG